MTPLRAGEPFWARLEGAGRRDVGPAHARELSAVRRGDARVERHGDAGYPRHLRHVFVLHLRAVRLRGAHHCRRRDPSGARHRRTSGARRSRGRTIRSGASASRCTAPFTVYHRSDEPWPRASSLAAMSGAPSSACWRWASGATGCRSRSRWRRCSPCAAMCRLYLKQVRPAARAVRHADQSRSARARASDLDAVVICRGAGGGDRPLLYAGDAGGHEGVFRGRVQCGGVPEAGASHRGGEPPPVRVRARTFRESRRAASGCCSTTSATSIRCRT